MLSAAIAFPLRRKEGQETPELQQRSKNPPPPSRLALAMLTAARALGCAAVGQVGRQVWQQVWRHLDSVFEE